MKHRNDNNCSGGSDSESELIFNSLNNLNLKNSENNNIKSKYQATSKKNINNIYQTNLKSSMRTSSKETNIKHINTNLDKIIDTRPIKDKSFQNDCISKIVMHYISFSGSDIVYNKELLNPDSRMFVKVFKQFINNILPSYEVQIERLDLDIPRILKHLKYPGVLNKNHLMAVGAPGAWQHVIALLAWMADLGVYMDNFREESKKYFKELEEIPNHFKNEKLKYFCDIMEKLTDLTIPNLKTGNISDEINKADKNNKLNLNENNESLFNLENINNIKLKRNLNLNYIENNPSNNLDTLSGEVIIPNKLQSNNNNSKTKFTNLIENKLLNSNYSTIEIENLDEIKNNDLNITSEMISKAIEEVNNELSQNYELSQKFHKYMEFELIKAAYVEFKKTKKYENSLKGYQPKFKQIDNLFENNNKVIIKIDKLFNDGEALLENAENMNKKLDLETQELQYNIELKLEESKRKDQNIERLKKQLEEIRKKKENMRKEIYSLKEENKSIEEKIEKQTMTREEYDNITKQIKILNEEEIENEKEKKEFNEMKNILNEKQKNLINLLKENKKKMINDYEKYGLDKTKVINYSKYIRLAEEIHLIDIQYIEKRYLEMKNILDLNKTDSLYFHNEEYEKNYNELTKMYQDLKCSFEDEIKQIKTYLENMIEEQTKNNIDLDKHLLKLKGEIMKLEDKRELNEERKIQVERECNELDIKINEIKEKRKLENLKFEENFRKSEEKLRITKDENERRKIHLNQVLDQNHYMRKIYKQKCNYLLKIIEKAQSCYENSVQKIQERKKENIKFFSKINKQNNRFKKYLLEEIEKQKENSDEDNEVNEFNEVDEVNEEIEDSKK